MTIVSSYRHRQEVRKSHTPILRSKPETMKRVQTHYGATPVEHILYVYGKAGDQRTETVLRRFHKRLKAGKVDALKVVGVLR